MTNPSEPAVTRRVPTWLKWVLGFIALEVLVEVFFFLKELWRARDMLHLLG